MMGESMGAFHPGDLKRPTRQIPIKTSAIIGVLQNHRDRAARDYHISIMKFPHAFCFLSLFGLHAIHADQSAAAGMPGEAGQKPQLMCKDMPRPDSGGWKPLLAEDGSDAEYSKDAWTFANGIWESGKDACLWTNGEYGNFILDLEFKTAPGTNSGVIIYCTDVKNWIPNSVEIQIADPFAEKWAKADPKMHGGGVFGHVAPTKQVTHKPGEWNRMTIRAKGREITVWLNGEQTAHMNMGEWTSARNNPDGSAIPGWLSQPKATLSTKGRIGLQGKHGDAMVWFRNLRIKPL